MACNGKQSTIFSYGSVHVDGLSDRQLKKRCQHGHGDYLRLAALTNQHTLNHLEV